MKGMWRLLMAVGLIALSGALALSQQEGPPKALSIVVEEVKPPEGQGFEVKVWVDKGCGASYQVGDYLTIFVQSAQAGYLTIYDFTPTGQVIQVFPNQHHPDNYIQANQVYQIPGPGEGYKFRVEPPEGMDIIKAIVTTQPGIAPAGQPDESNPFPRLSNDPEEFAKTLSIVVEPAKQWGAGTCKFYIGPKLGDIRIESEPTGAEVYWDGAFYWFTPITIPDQRPGPHQLTLKRKGYQDWSGQVVVKGGETVTVHIVLQPLEPGWQSRAKPPERVGDVTTIWATAFNSDNATPINGWYWLRDPQFQNWFGYRFPIDPALTSASEAWLNLTPLVTNAVNGGPGFETTVNLFLAVKTPAGNVVTSAQYQVHLNNPFRPKSPVNSQGVGYQTYGLLPLPADWLATLPVGGILEVKVSRLPSSYDGTFQPHVALNPDAVVLRYR